MVPQRDRLRPLQVRVPRHGIGDVREGEVAERFDEGSGGRGGEVALLTHEHAIEQRHLVVAGTGGVEAPGGRADLVPQKHLDVGMDVLQFGAPLDLARAELLQHAAETRDDRFGVGLGNDSRRPEHARVRDRARDVVLVEATVDAGGVVTREVVHRPFEATAPGALFLAHVSNCPTRTRCVLPQLPQTGKPRRVD